MLLFLKESETTKCFHFTRDHISVAKLLLLVLILWIAQQMKSVVTSSSISLDINLQRSRSLSTSDVIDGSENESPDLSHTIEWWHAFILVHCLEIEGFFILLTVPIIHVLVLSTHAIISFHAVHTFFSLHHLLIAIIWLHIHSHLITIFLRLKLCNLPMAISSICSGSII